MKDNQEGKKEGDSNFFEDPLNPQPEEWSDWPPEKWIEWSKSEEYKELYVDPKNIYKPSGLKQPDPDSIPVLDYREKQPVISVQWSTQAPETTTTRVLVNSAKKKLIKGQVSPPPETYLPLPTQSPTEDPTYVYANKDYGQTISKSQVKDIQPEFIINKKKYSPSSINSDYIYNKGFESSGLPSAEYSQLSNLNFERFKDRDSGAVNPSMLLLTQKPNYLKTGFQGDEYEGPNQIASSNGNARPSFQEGLSPNYFDLLEDGQQQGSLPAQGSVQDPQTRPSSPNSRDHQNRFRPPQYRPGRPGQGQFPRQQQQTPNSNPNLPDNSNLSPEVFLPPIDKNNPNFQDIHGSPGGGAPFNPYFPPNNPYQFPNQYPPPAPAPVSSSSSTTSGGGGSSAAASASAGHASSSSTSVSSGGTNTNDNKYYECTAAQCPDREEQKPLQITDENRNVFIADPTTTTTVRTTTREPNLLENITFANRGQQVNLNIPPGVAPPLDLQEAIDRGGTVNVNCDRTTGCSTLIPPEDRSTTTSTTTSAPAFRISISPLFGNINRGNNEEVSSSGSDTTAGNPIRDRLLQNTKVTEVLDEETDELPLRGLGDDYINEIYEVEAPVSRPNRNRVASIDSSVVNSNNILAFNERVAEIPSKAEEQQPDTTAEDLKSIVEALSGLIHLLNNTDKGRHKPLTPSNQGFPLGGGHLGNKRYPVKNIIFDDEATFERIKSQNLPDGDIVYFNQKKPLPKLPIRGSGNINLPSTTIPPHLIPLGPDGTPLVRPDGSYIASSRPQSGQLSQMFPYLQDHSSVTTTTVSSTTISTEQTPLLTTANTTVDNRDMITRAIDMINDMPMNTRRHMLANMIMGVPMAALTMAAVGLPPLGIVLNFKL